MDISKYLKDGQFDHRAIEKMLRLTPEDVQDLKGFSGLLKESPANMTSVVPGLKPDGSMSLNSALVKNMKVNGVDELAIGLDQNDMNNPELLRELAELENPSNLLLKEKSKLVKEVEAINLKAVKSEEEKSALVRDRKEIEKMLDPSKVVKSVHKTASAEEELKRLDAEIEACDKGIGQFMRTDKEKAQEFVRKKRKLQTQRETLAKTVKKKAKPRVTAKSLVQSFEKVREYDVVEIEEKVHDIEKMYAASVVEEESKLMEEMAAKASEKEREVYLLKKDQADLNYKMKMSDIESDSLPITDYAAGMIEELDYEKALLIALTQLGAREEDIKRVSNRIDAINTELKDIPPEDLPKDEPESQPETSPSRVENVVRTNTHYMKKNAARPSQVEKKSTGGMFFISAPVAEREVIDFSKVNKEQYQELLVRLRDYTDALGYFTQNEMQTHAERFVKRISKLKKALELVKQGNEIDMSSAPDPLRPVIIFLQTPEAKAKAFEAFQSRLKAQANQQKKFAAECNKNSKRNEQLKALGKKYVQKEMETRRMIEALKATMANRWQPLPVFNSVTTQEKVDVVQGEVKANEMLVDFNADSAFTGTSDCRVDYVLSVRDQSVKGSFEAYKRTTVTIDLAQASRHIEKGKIELTLSGKAFAPFKNNKTVEVRLDKFANQGKIKYELEDSAGMQRILLLFKIRRPTLASEIIIEEFKELRITRIYPPFRRDAEEGLRRAVSLMPSEDKAIQQDPFEEKVAPRSVFVAKVKGDDPPAGFLHGNTETVNSGKERFIDIDTAEDLVSIDYIDKRLAEYKSMAEKCKSLNQEVPEKVREKLQLLSQKKMELMGKLGSEEISAEEYKRMLAEQLAKDDRLLLKLEDVGQIGDILTVEVRKECTRKLLSTLP